MNYLQSKRNMAITAVISFVLGAGGASLVFSQKESPPLLPIRENPDKYRFINPLLIVNLESKEAFHKYATLQGSLRNYIKSLPKEKIESASVYFHDFESSTWTGVNEEFLYAPSSMLKVIIMIAYLRNPEYLDEWLYVKPNKEIEFYKQSSWLKEGSYKAKDLVVRMIVDSDNDAMFALIAKHRNEVLEIYEDLRLPDPNIGPDDFMSPRSYSKVLRTLFNSTYLSRNLSEQALQLLTETSWKNGIVSGIGSSSIPVAHKFGEHAYVKEGKTVRELHDCGIVYYPSHPYVLCVMTKGSDFKELEKAISDISRITFVKVKENPI